MRQFHHEMDPYNQPIFIIDYFKVVSDCFKVISNHYKTIKNNYFKIISNHFKTKNVLDQPNKDSLVSSKNY